MRGPVTDTRREDILSCTGVAFLQPWVARGCSSSPVPALRSSIMLIIKWQIAVQETQKPTTPACAPRGVKTRLQGMPPTRHPPGGFLWGQNAEGFIDHCRSCSDRQQLPASLGVRQPAPHVHTMPVQPGMPSPTPVIPEGLNPCELELASRDPAGGAAPLDTQLADSAQPGAFPPSTPRLWSAERS